MNHLFLVHLEKRDAYHSENSKNLLFWDKVFFIVLNDIAKTIVAFFHNNPRKIILIFHNIYNLHNHWVI
jgi:hypothetical protein